MNKHNTMANGKEPSFFIIGCQRSGTTLLRLILESHSKIMCYDEPTSYSKLNDYSHNPVQSNMGLVGFKIPLLTEQLDEPFFSDVNLDFIIDNNFQKIKRIFLIRDVRDTIYSMMNLKQENSTWYNIWPKKSIDFWVKTIPNFSSKFSHDLNFISKSNDSVISYASLYWKIKNMSLFNYEKNQTTLCKIKYEDLVTIPEKSIKKVIDFLEMEWEDSLMYHHKFEHSETNKNGITVGDTNTKKSIFSDSIGIYETKLSKTQIEEIMNISGEIMLKLEYKV